MTTVLLAAALVLALVLLVLAELTIRRERIEAAEERRELYQRIQAPELAVAEAVRRDRPPRRRARPIAADDDAAFAARNEDVTSGD